MGDLLVFFAKVDTTGVSVSSISGGGVSTWTRAASYSGYPNHDLELWTGVVSTAGASTVTVKFSASVTSTYTGLASEEFAASSGVNTTWSVDTSGGINSAASTAVTFPKLTPSGTGELYFAYDSVANSASAGKTSGFTYATTSDGDIVAYDVNVSSAQQPTATQSPSGVSGGVGVLIVASGTGSAGTTVTFNGNGSTGGSMANETHNVATALTTNAFTKTGYTFAGWGTSAGGPVVYANGASYPFTASTTLYAQWTQRTTLSAVGNFVTNGSNGKTTTSATLVQTGDLLVIWVKSRFAANPAIHVTNISASGTGAIGTLVNAIQYYTVDHPGNDDEIWYAPVTTAGTITLTFTWSGASSSDFNEYSTQEYHPSAPSTYSLDTTNSYENSTATVTMQFPTLTPVGPNELYAGYNSNGSSGSYTTPTTAGYTADVTSDGDAILVDPNVSASVQSPFTTATSQPSTQSSIGVLIVATSAS